MLQLHFEAILRVLSNGKRGKNIGRLLDGLNMVWEYRAKTVGRMTDLVGVWDIVGCDGKVEQSLLLFTKYCFCFRCYTRHCLQTSTAKTVMCHSFPHRGNNDLLKTEGTKTENFIHTKLSGKSHACFIYCKFPCPQQWPTMENLHDSHGRKKKCGQQ